MALPFDTITATTLQLLRKRLADNIFKANGTAAWFLMRGRVQLESGGKYIQEPLMYATNGTVMSYAGYEKLNVNPTDEVTAAQYAWRQAAVSIGISGLEDLQNDGPAAVLDLLKAKVRVAELSLRQWLDEKLHAATSAKDTVRDFLGLDELIQDDTTYDTVGGIDRTAESWWRNQLENNVSSALGASTTLLTNRMNSAYNNVTKGLTQPDLIMTNQTLFERYENDNRDKLRLNDTRLMEVGFQNLRFKNAVMMWNENIKANAAATSHMYWLNSEFMRLVLHRRRNFVMSKFVEPYDQDAQVSQILLAGNMTMNNSRFQSVQIEDAS